MRSRGGFALAVALAAIVLIAVLVTAALFASGQEAHATAAEIRDQQTSAYAERAALLTIAKWQCAECDGMPVGGVIISNPAPDPPLASTVFITRLDSALFLVTAEGSLFTLAENGNRRRISIVVRTSRDSLGIQHAARVSTQSWAASYEM